MKIDLLSLSWKNFLATGNDGFELTLDTQTTLFIGANGSGKSTILDALCYALFDRTYRGQKKTEVINNINNTGTLVRASLKVGGKLIKITRGMKPAIFEIEVDGKKLDSHAKSVDQQKYLEGQLLRLNFRSFVQIVMLGSASFVPFMRLKAAPRREVVEDILDIGILSQMSRLLKGQLDEAKQAILASDRILGSLGSQVEVLERQAAQIAQATQTASAEELAAIDEAEASKAKIDAKVRELEQMAAKVPVAQINAKIDELSAKRADAQRDLVVIDKDRQFFASHDHCSTCSQPISHEHKAHIKEQQDLKAEEAERIVSHADAALTSLRKVRDGHTAIVSQITGLHRDGDRYSNIAATLRSKIERQKATGSDVSDITTNKIAEIKAKMEQQTNIKAEWQVKLRLLETGSILLKDDGIRGFVVSQYLPKINQLVNYYLNALDFFVEFSLDDGFNETIKRGFRDVFSYESFSEGQKQRIDLALLFTWRAVAKLKSSVDTNLLILDEVFDSSLDEQGMEDLQKILGTLDPDTKIVVISHRGQSFDKFERVFRVRQDKQFSVYEEVQG